MPDEQIQLMVTVIDLAGGRRADVLVEADPQASVAALAWQFGQVVRAPADAPVLYVDGEVVDPRHTLAESPIRDGAVVSLGDPTGSLAAAPARTPELRVVGGPDAGATHPLGSGTVVVGRGGTADVRVADPYLSDETLTLRLNGDCRVELAADVPARLDGEPLVGKASWPAGTHLAVGASLFEWVPPSGVEQALRPSQDGAGRDFNRPPRVRSRHVSTLFRLPTTPKDDLSRAFPLMLAITPLVAGVAMALVTRQWAYLLVSLLTPVGWLVQYFVEKRQGRKSARRRMREYEEQRERIEADARAALAEERAARRRDFPDPAHVLDLALRPRAGLWCKRRLDPDFLVVRVGTGAVDSEVRVEDPDQADHRRETVWCLEDAPVTVPLRQSGVLGVASGVSLGQWIVAQIAALHSPVDVRVCLLTDESRLVAWDWVRWLPHARSPVAGAAPVWVGNDESSVTRRIDELTTLLSARQKAADQQIAVNQPAVVVVIDGARRLRDVPGVVRLLSEGPSVGIHAVCLDSEEMLLPGECSAVVVEDGLAVRVQQAEAGTVTGVRPDHVRSAWCERLARALAPLRDISDRGEDARLPHAIRLLDVLGLEPPVAENVAARWRVSGRSTQAVIGVGLSGPFAVDLDARHDGPHGLVAGTTGAGKSELLQTLIASLAVVNRPDEMTFVLVDYKGGSAFSECAALPHTVGLVTDLDGHLTQRALQSLAAELRRRERLLLRAGAKDVADYATRRAADRAMPALPRLLIVIDEFASLVAELPDFVAGLVDIARRGRSLGVHLLLATQRPAGVVTADIRANTNLRIALRVTDPAESADIIDAPDAARIPQSTPGRCFVRSGAAPVQAVQAARIGGARPHRAGAPAPDPRIVPMTWSQLGWGLPAREEPEDDTTVTDLAVFVDAIRAAAQDIPAQQSPWLPPLPDVVALDSLAEEEPLTVPFGLIDLPAIQGRANLSLDLANGGHLVIAGSAQSGRSTALRTIAGAIAARTAPTDVHVYAIDCGANALLPLAALPHCGAVVTRDQIDRMERLLDRVHEEVARRQQLLAAAGFSSLTEHRAHAEERLPYLVLLLDRWEGFVAAYENYDYGRLVDTMIRLLREGPAVGLRAVVTGDRTALTGPISTVFDQRLTLRMADPGDYSYTGINERHVPTHMPNGRVLEQTGNTVRESQIALLDPDPAGTAQVAALQRLARTTERPRDSRPMRVDPLPMRVTAAEARALEPGFTPPSPLWALIGAGGDDLAPVGVDLQADGPGFVIAGPPRSGRSTTLATMTQSLLDKDIPILLITPRRSPLRDLTGPLAVLDADADQEAVLSAVGDHSRYVVVVDDAELLRDTPLDDVLADLLRSARDGEHALVIAATTEDLKSTFRGFTTDALRARTGLLLAIQSPDDGDLFGVRLPRNNAGGGPTGRALLLRNGTTKPVQVAVS
ncbi:MAG: FtsK/SpoIIIE domain-containing protein [Labedaea sp.]